MHWPEHRPRHRRSRWCEGARHTGGIASLVPLHVVLVHWNQPDACAVTVGDFLAQEVRVALTVVDNCSREPERARLHALLDAVDDVTIVEVDSNLGFGGGANVGLRRWLDDPAGSEWALLAPHDAHPMDGCIRQLMSAVEAEPMAGLACADVGDGHIPVLDAYFGGITMEGSPSPGWQPADYPHGTLMALRRSCLSEIGLFDERFFAYCEEAELALRATAAGWSCGLVRGARVRNTTVGSSVAVVDYLQQRNTLYLVRLMSGRYHVFVRLVISLFQILSGVIRPQSAPLVFHPRARLRGIADFLRGRTGPPPQF